MCFPPSASLSHAADLAIFLIRLLPFLPLCVPFCVDLVRERVLELKRPKVDKEDMNGQKYSGWSSIQKTRAQETHCASPVHRRAREIEWKSGHGLIHQDAKIVA